MKIVVWQTAFLGDLILTTPLLATLKNIYPEAKLSVIAKPFGKDVLKHNPNVDEIIVFDKRKDSTFSLIRKLKEKKFDLAVSPHRSHRAAYSLFLSRIPERIGFDKAGFSFLYTKKAKHTFDGVHEIDRNFRLLELLPDFSPEKVYRFSQLFLTEEEENFIKTVGLTSKNYIAVAPGSKWETKRWTREGFAEVIDRLSKDTQVVLIGGAEDKGFTEEILSLTKTTPINLVGKTSLRESFSVIRHAKALISNDSAPVHMAVAFNVPVVDIYGPTTTDLGFFPYRNGIVVEIKDLDCRPCGLHGHQTCPKKTHECMKLISPDMVLNSLNKILKEGEPVETKI